MEPLRPRKPKRLYSAVAVVGGALLLMFELRRIRETGPAGWFWMLVAGLMIALGFAGVLLQDPDDTGRRD